MVYRPEREAQVLQKVMARNEGPLHPEEMARLFREIMSACLAQQEPLKIGYLGPEGTFSQQAVFKQISPHYGAANFNTPTLVVHGENDNDVPIAEARRTTSRPRLYARILKLRFSQGLSWNEVSAEVGRVAGVGEDVRVEHLLAHEEPLAELVGGAHPLPQRRRYRLPRLVDGEAAEHPVVPGPLLQHLARGLHEVPLGGHAGVRGEAGVAAQHVVQEVADFLRQRAAAGLGLDALEELGLETAQAVLEECAKLNEGVIAPLNWEGDKNPSFVKDGVVTTTPGFKEAYRQYAEGGWQGLQHPVAHGGQGLPKTIGFACTEMLNAASISFAPRWIVPRRRLGCTERRCLCTDGPGIGGGRRMS